MKRAMRVLALLAGAGLAAAPAAAQNQPVTFYLGRGQTDTAFGLMPGATMQVPVRMLNPNYSGYPYWYPTHVRVRVHFDPAKVAVVGAFPDPSALYSIDSFTPGSGVATVEASGYAYGLDAPGFVLSLQLQGGVTDGAWLWLQPDSVQTYSYSSGYAYPPGLSRIGQACHASKQWGDVDGNGRVDSRDALITLSAAVGLPVAGFDLASGDVDGDGLANSRDALMMLSHAIGITPSVSVTLDRTGEGVPDACPALASPGETVVFVRSGAAGGILRLDSLSTTPVPLTATPTDAWPRLNAAGTLIAFQCVDGTSNPQICRMGRDGANRGQMTGSGLPYRVAPDWSPSGAQVAYLVSGADSIYTMDSSGTAQTFVPASPLPTAPSVAWSRDGTQLLYGAGSLWTVLANPPYSLGGVTGPSNVQAPVRWSPDGLTIAFKRVSGGQVWTVPSGGSPTPTQLTWFQSLGWFDWGPQGLLLSIPGPNGAPSLWLMQGGPGGPLVRLTDPGVLTDDQASFRRNP